MRAGIQVILLVLGMASSACSASDQVSCEMLRSATYELVQDPSSTEKMALWQKSLETAFPIGSSHDEVIEVLKRAPSSFRLEEDNTAERRVIFMLKPDPHLWNRLDVWIEFGPDMRVVGYAKFFLIGPANE
jgi:hypothetical protein